MQKSDSVKREQMAWLAQMAGKMLQTNMLDFDDEAFDDDEDIEDLFEDDAVDVLANALNFIRGKAEPITVVADQKVKMEKGYCDVAARVIATDAGVTSLTAAPAAGKTTILPLEVNEQQGKPVLVVVPNEIILADVCSKMTDVKVVAGETVIGTNDTVVYTDVKTMGQMLDNERRPQLPVTVLMDEFQDSANKLTMEPLVSQLATTNRVVLMNGNDPDQAATLPMCVRTEARHSCPEKTFFHKKLIVLEDEEAVRLKRNHNIGYNLMGPFEAKVSTFQRLRDSDHFTLFATLEQTHGMDLPFDAVFAPELVQVRGITRRMTSEEHYQLANRLGRYGQDGVYFGKKNLRNLEIKGDHSDILFEPVVNIPVKKKRVRSGRVREPKVQAANYEGAREVAVPMEPVVELVVKLGFDEEQQLKSKLLVPMGREDAVNLVDVTNFKRNLQTLLIDVEIMQTPEIKKELFFQFCSLRNNIVKTSFEVRRGDILRFYGPMLRSLLAIRDKHAHAFARHLGKLKCTGQWFDHYNHDYSVFNGVVTI